MQTLINLSLCCEQATVITDFSKLEEVGKSHYLTINGGSAPSEIYNHLNGESIARELIGSGDGKITPYGVLFENGMLLESLYSGASFPAYMDKPYLMEFEIDAPREGAVTLFLPQPKKRLERLLKRADVRDTDNIIIRSWHSELPEALTDRLDIPNDNFSEVNRLCRALSGMDDAQIKKLTAVTMHVKPEYAFQVRHLAENLDQFDFVPNVRTAEEYGRYMIQKSGHFEYDENLDEYYDYAKYGLRRYANEDGEFNELGYISYHGTMSFEELMMEEPTEQTQEMTMT